MNKRIILPAMIILCVQFVIAQTQVQQRFDGVLLQEAAEPAEETDVPAAPVTGADWLHLAELTGDSYLGQLELLLSDPSAAGDLQSFALAECLWFSCFEPEAPVQQKLFDKTAAAVRLFLDGINSGAVIPNGEADAVYYFFAHLTAFLPDYIAARPMPDIPVLRAVQTFTVPSENVRVTALYRGVTGVQQLIDSMSRLSADATDQVKEENAGSGSDLSGVAAVAAAVQENPAVLYVLSHDDGNADLYRQVCDTFDSSDNTVVLPDVFRCLELLESCRQLALQCGFELESVLPSFSAEAVSQISADDFLIYCIPEQELDRLISDLQCISWCAPYYTERLITLLRQPVPVYSGEGVQ